jgi:hypothetical protein
MADYTGKWTETVAISHNGPSDPDYFRLARQPPGIGSEANGWLDFPQGQ